MNYRIPIRHIKRQEGKNEVVLNTKSSPSLSSSAIYDREMSSVAQVEDGSWKNVSCISSLSNYPKLSTEVWCQNTQL